jgi:4-methylaminobutanoate oxidase (formaldehyde-forming)
MTNVFDPVKRSPGHREHARLGARFAREAGWEVPATYGSVDDERRALGEGVAVADVTARGKIDVRGDLQAVLRRLCAKKTPAVGAVAPGGSTDARGHVARLAERWALMLCEPDTVERCLAEAEAETNDGAAMVTDATSLYAGFALFGPDAAGALSRLTSFDAGRMAEGTCAATRVAEAPAILVRPAVGGAPFELYLGSEYARYAWESLLEAGAELGIRPAGWEALHAEGWW